MKKPSRHQCRIATGLLLCAIGAALLITRPQSHPHNAAAAGFRPELATATLTVDSGGIGTRQEDGRSPESRPLGSSTLTGAAAKEQLRKSGQYESLAAAFQAARYAIEKVDPSGPHSRGAEYFAANPEQQLRAWFRHDGIELASGRPTREGAEPWSVQVRLRAAGRAGTHTEIAPRVIRAEGNRVEMSDREGAIVEWYENKREGIEQGFTIERRPPGTGTLELVLGVEGSVRATPDGARISDANGADLVSVTGLKAWDADGRALDARMDVRGSEFALLVADAGARYPVTIDPLFANVEGRLVEESVARDQFGYSLALSGDTAVIGAPYDATSTANGVGSAYVFVRSGMSWSQQTKLVASDGFAADQFGYSVAVSGDTALVGANQAYIASAGRRAGSAYVFVRSGTSWSQEARLAVSDSDQFGYSVALNGDTALVGAAYDDTVGFNAGSSYVFVRSGTSWSQEAKLSASDAAPSDTFGYSVALSGDTALVGAPYDGSAYVFVRSGTIWTHATKLTPSDGVFGDNFGYSVALSSDTALVGAPLDDTASGPDAGSSYVFVRSGTIWNQQAKLAASDGEAYAQFGYSVAMSGDTALIGAPRDDTTSGTDAGSGYVFVRSGTTWSQQAQHIASDGAASDQFGYCVALSGDTALVGAPRDDTASGTDAGSGYVFVRSGTTWSKQAQFTAGDAASYDYFGSSVAVSGNTALIGAPYDTTIAGPEAGSAYVFLRNGTIWTQQAKLTASDASEFDEFAISVALSGDTALIGTFYGNTAAGPDAGSAYVFVRSGTIWSQQAKLTASDGGAYDQFGFSVGLSGNTALVGAYNDGTPADNAVGSAYVFVRNETTWIQQAKLTASDGSAYDYFGVSVALSSDTALIGAIGDDTTAGTRSGSAYVFVRSGATWSEQSKLTASDGSQGVEFGSSVALSGDTALVGAPFRSTGGSAYVFVRGGTIWTQQARLTASDGTAGDEFGFSVALSGDTALVGAHRDDTPSGGDSGSAYVFARSGTRWIEQVKLTAGVDSSPGDSFGYSVALDGNTALVGAYREGTAGPDAGSAYVFLLGELPSITQQPLSRTVVPGVSVTFNVAATGYSPLHYQWRKDGDPIEGAIESTFTVEVPAQSPFDAVEGTYDVVVFNIGGVATSAPAVLKVNALSQFTQTFPAAPPDAQGFLFVSLAPSGILHGWRFVGERQWRSSGVPVGGLTTGDRSIEFRPVPGYIQPPQESVSVISGEAATILTRDYYETSSSGTGGLTVTLKPEALADAAVPEATRAQWRLLGEDDTQWRDSSTSITGLSAGAYLVECKPVAGRTTPVPANVIVTDAQTSAPTITYFLPDATSGTPASVLAFEAVTTDQTKPYAHVGQLRSNAGSSTGFVVKTRVVATAAHVVWDDGTLSAVQGLQWLHQQHRGTYEPKPIAPRGFYIFDGYAAQRVIDNTPGASSPESQTLDVAAIYFNEDAGRGGYSGFLASDFSQNEFLLSNANKILVGYPVDGVAATSHGRMFATPPANVSFTAAFGRTFTTTGIHSSGGMSGGPLCIQFEGGNYYPAAVYLGGTNQTVVRSIDSAVIDLFNRAEVSGNGGDNNTGAGITHSSFSSIGSSGDPGALEVTIMPAAARNAGAGWRLKPETSYRDSGFQKGNLKAGSYILQMRTVAGFDTPAQQSVTVNGGQLRQITYTYAVANTAPSISAISNRTINEDGTTGAIAFTVGDADTSASSLTLTRASSNLSLVTVSNIELGGNGANRTVAVTPAPNLNGTANITLTVSDGEMTASETFTLTVSAVNDAPIMTPPANQTLALNTASGSLAVLLADVDNSTTSLTLTATSSNPTLIPNAAIVVGGGGSSRTLLITPSSGQLGTAVITLTTSDGSLADTADFTVQVFGTPLETWRFANFGNAENSGNGTDSSDTDRDGQTNAAEYAAGTDPNNPADVFRVMSSTFSGGAFRLTVPGKAGRTYVLQHSDTPSGGAWTAVATAGPLSVHGNIELTDPAPVGPKRFYRVSVSVP